MQFLSWLKRFAMHAPVAGLIGASAWLGTTLLAGACVFWQLHQSQRWFAPEEIMAYMAAFGVAGTLSGVVAVGVRGKWNWATATLIWALLLLAAAGTVLVAYPLLAYGWGSPVGAARRRAIDALAAGGRLGLPAGLLVCLCVAALEPLLRRGHRWAAGAVVALGVTVATGWGINNAVMYVTWMGINGGWDVDREVLWGAAVGGVIGALVGGLAGELVGWAACADRPARAKHRSARKVSGRATR